MKNFLLLFLAVSLIGFEFSNAKQKDARCFEIIKTEGLCDMSLGEHVFFNQKTKKCEVSFAGGCKLISVPFKVSGDDKANAKALSECQKLCEK